jgi:hypothetical protein
MNLKDQLIKLGSDNPSLRKHIRPVLDKVAGVTNHIVNLADFAKHFQREVSDYDHSFEPKVGLHVNKNGEKFCVRGRLMFEEELKVGDLEGEIGLTHTEDMDSELRDEVMSGVLSPAKPVFSRYLEKFKDEHPDVKTYSNVRDTYSVLKYNFGAKDIPIEVFDQKGRGLPKKMRRFAGLLGNAVDRHFWN